MTAAETAEAEREDEVCIADGGKEGGARISGSDASKVREGVEECPFGGVAEREPPAAAGAVAGVVAAGANVVDAAWLTTNRGACGPG